MHRDLKPENVFITRDGRVKILDFGLAQLAPAARGADDSPTVAAGTEPGLVLGTVGYISPEQVRGTRIDLRTDIFALGAVLFEMLTGRRAFLRETAAETMTAILRDDVPELSSTGRQVPAPLDRIVRRCVEKNPDERLQAARDVAIALEAVSGSDVSGGLGPFAVATTRRGSWRRLAIGVAALLASAGLGYLAAMMRAPTPASAELPRFRQLTFRRGEVRTARFAPDGQSIVYSAFWDGDPHRIYAVRIDRLRAQTPPLGDAALLAVSRSGDMAIAVRPHRETYFVEPGTLAQLPLGGGAPREVLEDVVGADFAGDGRMLVVRSDRGRTRLELPIGTVLYETAAWLSSPRVSPDGTRVAFHEYPLDDDDRGWPAVVDIATRAKRNLTGEQEALSGLTWTPGGESVCFGANTAISCADVDKTRMRVVFRGPQRIVLHDIAGDGRMLAATLGGHNGLIAGEVGGREVDLSWQDVAYPIDFSPDGRRLLLGSLDYGIHLGALDGTPPVRLAEGVPVGISPDGRSVLVITPGVPTTIAVVPIGTGATRTLSRGLLEAHTWAAWTPDGRHVVIGGTEPGHTTRLYVQDVMSGEPRAISGEGVRLLPSLPRLVTPDGRFVIAVGPDRQPVLYPLAGGEPRPIPALGNDLTPIAWGESSQVPFARRRVLGRLAPLFKLDLTSRKRLQVAEVGPSDPNRLSG